MRINKKKGLVKYEDEFFLIPWPAKIRLEYHTNFYFHWHNFKCELKASFYFMYWNYLTSVCRLIADLREIILFKNPK